MKDKLKEIIISVTNRCNLRCRMCQIPLVNNKEMTTEELKRLIEDIPNLYPETIVFSGGEPLLREDVFDLISLANKRKINVCLTSNGTLIDEEIAKKLSLSGITVINISIEGNEEIHDYLRGKGTFRKAIKALENLSRYKIETTIATVVCRQNYISLPYIMDLAYQFGVTTVKFQPFNEIFLIEKEKKEEFFGGLEDLEKLRSVMKELIELSQKYKIATNPIDYLNAIPDYLCRLKTFYKNNSCLALWRSCPISTEGDVYPCWVFSDKILGNIKQTPIHYIWNSSKHNRLRNSIIKNGCSGCLMSCYDYNLGDYDLPQRKFFKINKFRQIKFYKRRYFRLYQILRYILNKIINHIFILNNPYKNYTLEVIKELEEIRKARLKLKEELKSLKNERG